MLKNNYKATVFAACIGYVVQAIVVNFAPLLYLTFQESYGISLAGVTLLTTVNFAIQLLTDVCASKFIPVLGYRQSIVLAHLLSAAGLILLAVLPFVLPTFLGLILSISVFAVGGGLLEVLIGPIVESCPTENKAGLMSLLHSFYCWGVVFSVGLGTLFFVFCGIENWRVLSCLFALLPLLNILLFLRVPIFPVEGDTRGETVHYSGLLRKGLLWLSLLLMFCTGASEIAVAQWASSFAEGALGVSKTVGDLVGVCGFSLMMAVARTLYSRLERWIPTVKALLGCSAVCVVSYLVIGLSESAVVSLIGVAVCGLAVGIFWPATFSTATARIPKGGTALFALLAFAGDLGCASGPSVVGFTSALLGDNLRYGILCAIAFPCLLFLSLLGLYLHERKGTK